MSWFKKFPKKPVVPAPKPKSKLDLEGGFQAAAVAAKHAAEAEMDGYGPKNTANQESSDEDNVIYETTENGAESKENSDEEDETGVTPEPVEHKDGDDKEQEQEPEPTAKEEDGEEEEEGGTHEAVVEAGEEVTATEDVVDPPMEVIETTEKLVPNPKPKRRVGAKKPKVFASMEGRQSVKAKKQKETASAPTTTTTVTGTEEMDIAVELIDDTGVTDASAFEETVAEFNKLKRHHDEVEKLLPGAYDKARETRAEYIASVASVFNNLDIAYIPHRETARAVSKRLNASAVLLKPDDEKHAEAYEALAADIMNHMEAYKDVPEASIRNSLKRAGCSRVSAHDIILSKMIRASIAQRVWELAILVASHARRKTVSAVDVAHACSILSDGTFLLGADADEDARFLDIPPETKKRSPASDEEDTDSDAGSEESSSEEESESE